MLLCEFNMLHLDKSPETQDIHCLLFSIYLFIYFVGFYPEENPSKNYQKLKTSLGPGGDLEIIFNQQ